MQVILLAAGMGLRLGHLTRATPKALIPLNGKPLLDHTLPILLANKRVSEVLVVGGFEFDRMEAHLDTHYSAFGDRVRLVQNPHFTKGNLFTLEAAIPFIEEDFLMTNVDHLFSEKTWKFILQKRETAAIFCDFFREFQPDEMKVQLNEERNLHNIAKGLTEHDAAYVGLTFIPKANQGAYRAAMAQAFQEDGSQAVVEHVLPRFAAAGCQVKIIPFDSHTWYEVDTRADLKSAESALAAVPQFSRKRS